jgi:transcriptional regulator with XRE-family HTH domain
MNNIHIGSIIREKLKERGMRVIDFANALHFSRSSAYSLFERRNIDLELLVSISKIIDCDLLALYWDNVKPERNYIAIIETNQLKINELSSDKRIKIVKAWKMSENPDIL